MHNYLENTKDVSKITLVELLNSFQAHEQRRFMSKDGMIEGALATNHKTQSRDKILKFQRITHLVSSIKNGLSTI